MYQKVKNIMYHILVMLLGTMLVVTMAEKHVEERRQEQQKLENQEAEPVTLEVWFSNTIYEPYLVSAAEKFQEEHENVTIRFKAIPDIEYIPALEHASHQGTVPDLYIIGSEYLQNAVRIGMAAETDLPAGVEQSAFAGKALENLCYHGTSYGYPLGFDTAVLMYHPDKVSTVPNHFDALMKQMEEGGAMADTFFQWDKNKFLCNYGFVGNYAEICGSMKDDETELSLNNENLIAAGTYYQKLCQTFSGTGTYEKILEQFAMGELSYTIVGSDILKTAEEWEIQPKFAAFPDLTEMLKTSSVSVTDIMMVNDFSAHKKMAEEFAGDVSYHCANLMFEQCGRLSAALTGKTEENRIFYEEYEKSQALPKLMSVIDYWNRMQNVLNELAQGKDSQTLFQDLHSLMEKQLAH